MLDLTKLHVVPLLWLVGSGEGGAKPLGARAAHRGGGVPAKVSGLDSLGILADHVLVAPELGQGNHHDDLKPADDGHLRGRLQRVGGVRWVAGDEGLELRAGSLDSVAEHGQHANAAMGKPRFPGHPLIIRVPFFLLFSLNKKTPKQKGQKGTTKIPRSSASRYQGSRRWFLAKPAGSKPASPT